MRFHRELAAELLGMFVGDRRLAMGILAIVAAAALTGDAELPSYVAGGVLLLGSPLLLLDNVRRSAARSRKALQAPRRSASSANPSTTMSVAGLGMGPGGPPGPHSSGRRTKAVR